MTLRRFAIALSSVALLALSGKAHAVAANALIPPLNSHCLTAKPPGLLETPIRLTETPDRETFAGPAERFRMKPDESIRMGITFATTLRACEFAVDSRALDPAETQRFAALALLAIGAYANGAEDLEVTAPENIPTYTWTAVPDDFTIPMAHRVELSTNENQTLIRSAIKIH